MIIKSHLSNHTHSCYMTKPKLVSCQTGLENILDHPFCPGQQDWDETWAGCWALRPWEWALCVYVSIILGPLTIMLQHHGQQRDKVTRRARHWTAISGEHKRNTDILFERLMNKKNSNVNFCLFLLEINYFATLKKVTNIMNVGHKKHFIMIGFFKRITTWSLWFQHTVQTADKSQSILFPKLSF